MGRANAFGYITGWVSASFLILAFMMKDYSFALGYVSAMTTGLVLAYLYDRDQKGG